MNLFIYNGYSMFRRNSIIEFNLPEGFHRRDILPNGRFIEDISPKSSISLKCTSPKMLVINIFP
uniref:Uncharacterized protein n=1 Tax=Rhizophagus irregularis (strain DAOM 181602 / DAOM 197198 / MUCL 43194) TaxID=747089 RepID=U9TY06_RHIID